jgi:hypothetical protein
MPEVERPAHHGEDTGIDYMVQNACKNAIIMTETECSSENETSTVRLSKDTTPRVIYVNSFGSWLGNYQYLSPLFLRLTRTLVALQARLNQRYLTRSLMLSGL